MQTSAFSISVHFFTSIRSEKLSYIFLTFSSHKSNEVFFLISLFSLVSVYLIASSYAVLKFLKSSGLSSGLTEVNIL